MKETALCNLPCPKSYLALLWKRYFLLLSRIKLQLSVVYSLSYRTAAPADAPTTLPSPPSLPFPWLPAAQAAADPPAARAAARGSSCRVSAAVSRQPQPGQAQLPRLLWSQPARSSKTGKATEKRSVGLSTCRCAAAPSWKSQQPSKLFGVVIIFFLRSAGRLELPAAS